MRATRLAVGTALIAGEQISDGVRTVRGKTVSAVNGLVGRTRDEADRRTADVRNRIRAILDEAEKRGRNGLAEAERRGRDRLSGGRTEATKLADGAVHGAVSWAQIRVVPQIVDGLVPHLISDVVPRIIDGAMPEIRARVVPVLIDDLTNDPRIRELIMAQSRGVLGQVTDQLRTGTTRADDRFEAAAHQVFGRNDKTARKAGSAKGPNEIRGA